MAMSNFAKAMGNYNNVQEFSEIPKIPAGAYQIEILRAEDTEQALCILFDITGGEYDKYYQNKFAAEKKLAQDNPERNPKYKGVLRLWYPSGNDYDETNRKRIKTTLETIKRNNNLKVDFSKEWDGKQLAKAKSAIILRDQEWEMDGNTGFTAQPFKIIDLDDYKNGKFEIPQPKFLNGNTPTQSSQNNTSADFEEFEDDDDLPF